LSTRTSLLLVGLTLLIPACSVTLEKSETTLTPAETATTLGALEPLLLAADGLGAIPFGAADEGVVADLTSRFGAPDRDSGWVSPDPIHGACPGITIRVVGWGSFEALFADGTEDAAAGFFAWTYGFDPATTAAGTDPRGLNLVTAEGVGLGTPRADLVAAYGSRIVADGSGLTASFRIDPGAPIGISGLLDGEDPAAVVTSIESFPGCGPRA